MILNFTYGAISQDVQQFGLDAWNWSIATAAPAAVKTFQHDFYMAGADEAEHNIAGAVKSDHYVAGATEADYF